MENGCLALCLGRQLCAGDGSDGYYPGEAGNVVTVYHVERDWTWVAQTDRPVYRHPQYWGWWPSYLLERMLPPPTAEPQNLALIFGGFGEGLCPLLPLLLARDIFDSMQGTLARTCTFFRDKVALWRASFADDIGFWQRGPLLLPDGRRSYLRFTGGAM